MGTEADDLYDHPNMANIAQHLTIVDLEKRIEELTIENERLREEILRLRGGKSSQEDQITRALQAAFSRE